MVIPSSDGEDKSNDFVKLAHSTGENETIAVNLKNLLLAHFLRHDLKNRIMATILVTKVTRSATNVTKNMILPSDPREVSSRNVYKGRGSSEEARSASEFAVSFCDWRIRLSS
ncbi:hypothetical protein TNCV_3090941 [Trichonephila clavipes]|uniref:Uncharacterized protein n=1 Tax=Trichonephila clavipes TaxID=2585209 RepID=A0A8X6W9D8_TRICX|nr:hypothetical protein TNCV_3090941 [Trichonephila clavipes]